MEAAANNSWEASAEAERVWASILSQSATGELIGMMNFASLVDLYEDAEDKIDALEHAFIEKGHARAFQRLGREMGVPVTVKLNAPYWKRIREAFLKSAGQEERTGPAALACRTVQGHFAMQIDGSGSTSHDIIDGKLQVSHRELIIACLNRKRDVIQTRALNDKGNHHRRLAGRRSCYFAFLRRWDHPRGHLQIAILEVEFFHKEEVFAQPCHHGNPKEKLVDLQRQPHFRSLVGESCHL